MANGPLSAGLIQGANLLQASQQQQLQQQQLQQKQKQVKLDNAIKSITLGIDLEDDSLTQSGFDYLNQVTGSTLSTTSFGENKKLFKKHFRELVKFGNTVATNPELAPSYKQAVVNFEAKWGLGKQSEETKKGVETLGKFTPEEERGEAKVVPNNKSSTGFSFQDIRSGDILAEAPEPSAQTQVTVNTGDLETGTKTQVQKDILASDRTIGQLNRAEATFKEEFLTLPGKVKGGLQRLSEKAGFTTDTGYLKEKARWFNQAKQAFFVYRKWVTGVAGGEKEMSDIAKAFPDPEKNSPSEYIANLKETRLWQRAVKKWLLETDALGLSISETKEILPEVGIGGEFETEGQSPEDEANAFLEG